MADFARWVTAAEEPLGWPEGAFPAAYESNREAVGDAALDASTVAAMVHALVTECGPWRGTSTDLICELRTRFPALAEDRLAFPRQPSRLGSELRRVMPLLRRKGVSVSFEREGKSRVRVIDLKPN